MKTTPTRFPRRGTAGFTLVEVLISMVIVSSVMAMTMSTFMMGMRTMYKDGQRLATNATLRSFMAQISKETLDASHFYLFDYYTKLDGTVNLATDCAVLDQDPDFSDPSLPNWVAHGDCLVLITKTSEHRTTGIRQIRVYYRRTKTQADRNTDAPLRYYETEDWGEGEPDDDDPDTDDTNGHPFSNLATYLNAINLNAATTNNSYDSSGTAYNPAATDFAGSRVIALRTRGRRIAEPESPNVAGDLYPMFSSESGTATSTDGFVSINVEFINGTGVMNMLSSSSFNYTISPRR